MVVHPSVRLLIGLSLVILSSALSLLPLLFLITLISLWLFSKHDALYLRWVRRARILLIVPPIVSGYTIAGTGVLPLDLWSPTWEGLYVGSLQSLKLLAALLSLRLALHGLSSAAMSRGLVGIISPLRHLGVDSDQLGRRLQLTLYHLERMDGLSARELLGAIRSTR